MDTTIYVRALAAAQTYRDAARDALQQRLASRHIDSEQRAAHGFAWVATSVAALEAMLGWLEAGGDANPIDEQVAQLAFAETIAQLIGGLPMGQNEMFRPMDLGLGDAVRALGAAAREVLYRDHAATRVEVAQALSEGHWPSEGFHDSELDTIRDQFRKFTEGEILPHAHKWHLANDLIPDATVEAMARTWHFRRLHSRGIRRPRPRQDRHVPGNRRALARLDRRGIAGHALGNRRRADLAGRNRGAEGLLAAAHRQRRSVANRRFHRTRCRLRSRQPANPRGCWR